MTGLFSLLADSSQRVQFEWGRDLSSPVDWLLPLGVFLLLAWFVVGSYLLDCVELGRRVAILLIGLRLVALIGILLVYLQPQWRAQRDIVSNSRVLMLVDTSQSMGRQDVPYSDPAAATGKIRRIDRVVRELESGTLLDQIRQVHDVVIYRFDQEDKPTPVATLARFPTAAEAALAAPTPAQNREVLEASRSNLMIAGGGFVVAVVLLAWYLIRPATGGATGPGPLVAAGLVFALVIGMTVWVFVTAPGLTARELLGLDASVAEVDQTGDEETNEVVDWQAKLVAQGASTKIGQAVFQLVMDERSTPVSAIVVFSDGQRTAGVQLEEAAKLAAEEEIPIYTVGLGSLEQPEFVRISDFAAPSHVHSNDPFEITAYLQSQGLAGRGAVVSLRQITDTESSQQDAEDTGLVYQAETTLGADSEDVVPVLFDIEGFETAGRYAFEMEVRVKGARKPAHKLESEAVRRFYIDVLDRRTKVLLVAGGPTREYRFLRSLLRRDSNIDLFVYLQSMKREKVDDPAYVTGFPIDADELAEYDAIVALDPDWLAIGSAAAARIEQWVSEYAGGLIVVPGNVNAGSVIRAWIYDPEFQPLLNLYPVEFIDRFAQTGSDTSGSAAAWPLEFTRAGADAEFLQLDDNPAESQRAWSAFPGIYGGFPVKAAKYGATVYARFGDSMAEPSGYNPLYFVGQFYGRGRVFYVASGEMWRLRQSNEAYFEQFYTRVIRHVAMGRIYQGSPRGDTLLLEKEHYNVGDTVPVTALLKNAAREPLDVPDVTLFVFDPNGKSLPLKLVRDTDRPGRYRGEFVVREAQDYRLDLVLPESDEQTISKVIKVTTSDRENAHPQQNDVALKEIAKMTGGRYFASIDAAVGQSDDSPLAPGLEEQTRVTPVAGNIDPVWKAGWSKWMMFAICGVLCIEWLLRRLLKLA